MRSSVVHAATFRARKGKGPLLGVCGFGRYQEASCTCKTDIVIFVLAGVVDYCANIQTLHPCISRAIVEKARIGAVPWQRTGQGESRRDKLTRDTEPFCIRQNLKLSPG